MPRASHEQRSVRVQRQRVVLESEAEAPVQRRATIHTRDRVGKRAELLTKFPAIELWIGFAGFGCDGSQPAVSASSQNVSRPWWASNSRRHKIGTCRTQKRM